MNILFVIEQLNIGGAQTFLIRLATQLPKNATNIYVWEIKPSERNEANYKKLIDNNIKIITAPYALWKLFLKNHGWRAIRIISDTLNAWFDFGFKLEAWAMRRFIRKNKIEIVNSHLYQADIYCCKILKNNSVKIISTFHGCYNLFQKRLDENELTPDFAIAFKKDINIIFKRLNGIIYLTERQLKILGDLLTNIPKQKIYNGFLPAPANRNSFEILNSEKNEWVFGMVARGDASKGWEEAIQAFLFLKKKYSKKKLRLNLIGGSHFMDYLKFKYVDNDIYFYGDISDPLPLISMWDIGLLPTYFPGESLPNSVIEYMYSQVPTIATDIAEIPNMLKVGEAAAGQIIPLNCEGKVDWINIAKAMQRYLDDNLLWQENKSNTLLLYKRFDINTCINEYTNYFKKILHN